MSDEISFGDTVQVLVSPETEALGVAGLQGSVFGQTTPSSTGIEVVGKHRRDYAINVFFETLDRSVWLAEELLRFVDHGQGATISLEGVDQQWVRASDGRWVEASPAKTLSLKPWWKFWA